MQTNTSKKESLIVKMLRNKSLLCVIIVAILCSAIAFGIWTSDFGNVILFLLDIVFVFVAFLVIDLGLFSESGGFKLLVILFICGFAILTYFIVNEVRVMTFTNRIGSYYDVTHMPDADGNKFLFYDAVDECFLNNILPSEYNAKSKEEVCGVFKLSKAGEKETCQYSNGKRGYTVKYLIELINSKDGSVVTSEQIWGNDPPKTIKNNMFDGGKVYGSTPSNEKLMKLCLEMLEPTSVQEQFS